MKDEVTLVPFLFECFWRVNMILAKEILIQHMKSIIKRFKSRAPLNICPLAFIQTNRKTHLAIVQLPINRQQQIT